MTERFIIRNKVLTAAIFLGLVWCLREGNGFASSEATASPAGTNGITAHLEFSSASVLEGDPVSVRAKGLRPGALATIHVQSIARDDAGKNQWFYGNATFMADASGTIDLATSAPVRGSYQGVDLHGLFWSEHPLTKGSAEHATLAALHLDDAPSIGVGQKVLTLEEGGTVRDRKVLTLVSSDASVVREDVRANDLVGAFYFKKGAKKCPLLVVLGGSEGGLDVADWIGPPLALRGFAVFGLNYYSPTDGGVAGVSTVLKRIPLELLEKARVWLKGRAEADIDRFGLIGYSKGSEFALVLASTYDWIDAVVAYAPPDVVWQGIQQGGGGDVASSWTRGGSELPFLPTTGTREEIVRGRQSGKIYLARVAKANLEASSPEALAAATIPVERSHAALLLIGGGDDQLWDSGASAVRVAARLKRADYPYPYEVLLYPAAGHSLVGTGWRPTTTDNTDLFQDGGNPEADAHAQADSWIRILAFLKKNLRS